MLNKPPSAPGDWPRQVTFDFEYGKRALLARGNLAMTFFLHHPTKGVAGVASMPWGDRVKLQVMDAVNFCVVATHAEAISVVAESWALPTPPLPGETEAAQRERVAAMERGTPIAEHPDRVEILSAHLIYRAGDDLRDIARVGGIVRNDKGKVLRIAALDWAPLDHPCRVTRADGFIADSLRDALTKDWTANERRIAKDMLQLWQAKGLKLKHATYH